MRGIRAQTHYFAHFAPFRRFINERESWPRAKERSELGTQQLGDSDSWAQGAQLGTMFRSEMRRFRPPQIEECNNKKRDSVSPRNEHTE